MEQEHALLTAQDIKSVQFTKTFGGYKTNEVDDFLDRCVEAVDTLTRINAENEHKMQVLGQSIVEYREQEDSIRHALLNAQRMSDTILEEAREKAAQMLADAESEASRIHEKAEGEIQVERDELKRVQNEVATFKARLLSIYREHLTLIGVLTDEEAPAEPDQNRETATAESTEPQAPVTDAVQEAPIPEPEAVKAADAPVGIAADSEETIPAARFDLSRFSLDDE